MTERPQSSFAMRGEELKNNFAKRYGGGFVSASNLTESFRNETGDMIKKVVTKDTKDINSNITTSLNDRIKEEISKSLPTYSKPKENNSESEVAPTKLNNLVSEISKKEGPPKRIMTSEANEMPYKNMAAALKTTADETINTPFNANTETKLEDSKGLDKNTIKPIEPVNVANKNESNIAKPINQKFNTMVNKIFGKQEKKPEDYKLSEMTVTYSKVTPPAQTTDATEIKANTKELPVNETSVSKETKPALTSSDTYTSAENAKINIEAQPKEIASQSYPWDKLKKMYTELYSPDSANKVQSMIREPQTATITNDKPSYNFKNLTESNLMRNTNQILRAQNEKNDLIDSLNSINENMNQQTDKVQTQPIILNNTKTIIAKDPSESKTARVFTDDHTFSRLSAYDSHHPQYSSFR